jgi:pimeloyl-ACP methyl ester carboxylesterase
MAALATLAACGGSGGDTPDPLQTYRTQTVQWTACDPTILGERDDSLDTLQPTGRLLCAQVRAPMDWSQPGRGDISLTLMRLAAGTPAKRRGALFFNPGGPGIDGLFLTFRLWKAFADSDAANAQGARQLRLLDEYDMVSFSPRGTGASTQLHCATNELKRFVDVSAAGWDTPENIANARYNDRKSAEACLKNPLTPYISTDATARDLDLLRSLLGDDKLNYLGYSYGTWLGAWYANLFPEKVGRMVLDSSMDFTSRFEEASLAQPPVRQRLFDEVLAPYAVRHATAFGLGTTTAEVRAVLPGLGPRVQQLLGDRLNGLSNRRDDAESYLAAISAARALDAVLQAAAPSATAAEVWQMLAAQVFDPADAAHDAAVRNAATALFNKYRATWMEPQPESIALPPDDAVYWAVQCNDTSATTDPAAWAALVRGIRDQAPIFFGGNYHNLCAYWGGPTVRKPGLEAMQPLPVLFVQSQYDAATATDGATRFFAQLPQARRVYVAGEYQHGIYPYDDACVDPQVTDYLLGEAPAQRETVCPGKPLLRDAAVQQKSASATPSAYRNPEKARALIDAFKRGLR